MVLDLFHSISMPKIGAAQLSAEETYRNTLRQALLAEDLGFDTFWVAESHFSSEVQKQNLFGTIPKFQGEVGINADSFQFIHWLFSKTKKIHAGTGIHNIVGGSGGPIASADRANMLRFYQGLEWDREIRLGIASGRFPYQNAPFGHVPKNDWEKANWKAIKQNTFLEALEIFIRLLNGEKLSSDQVAPYLVDGKKTNFYQFEPLELVPKPQPSEKFHFVLGSGDPKALELAVRYLDIDVFNLSFTSKEGLEKIHAFRRQHHPTTWRRSRLPRTVLVFADPDRKKARERASQVFDAYLEAMEGTAELPPKSVLLEKALIGDHAEIREQLHANNPRGFHPEDRLMLWFEFNILETEIIEKSMRYFMEKVAPDVV